MTHPEFDESAADFPATEAAPLDALAVSSAPAPLPSPPQAPIATFLYARVRNFNAACHSMTGAELTGFVNDVRRVLSSAVLMLGGELAQRKPDSVLCVFSHNPEDKVPTHAKRGLHAAVLTVHEAAQLAQRIAPRLAAAGLPPLTIAVGVHLGPGEVNPRTNSQGMVHATGEAVEIARLLEGVAEDMHCSIVTSAATRLAAGTRVDSGRGGTLGLPDDSFLEVVQITGLVPRQGSTTPPGHYAALRDSIQRNQNEARTAAGTSPAAGSGHLLIEDYRLLRKIGEGGVASVFLAQPLAGGASQVLKVLRLHESAGADMGLQRFMQEYALLAKIDHPNVARFFRQGFSAGSAYIAMEYFPLGDLRSRMRKPLDPAIALYYVRQIAAGLEALHEAGIVHRDLKPDNVMVRPEGIVAITDFGVAKQVGMQITDTGAGEIVGTPYYLSPEQALGRPIDTRCDLYSLGVMAFEMLTGSKPYHATTAQALLALHVNAPVPTLPPAHQRLQPVLDRLMAKDPAGRFATATQLLDALRAVAS